MTLGTHFFVIVEWSPGPRFFSRFDTHYPQRGWTTTGQRERAYCFAAQQDARHVVDQLRAAGKSARIVMVRPTMERPKAAPSPTIPMPPEDLEPWVLRIVEACPGSASGKSEASRISSGLRVVARQCHPDFGGKVSDMQKVNAAAKWIRENFHD